LYQNNGRGLPGSKKDGHKRETICPQIKQGDTLQIADLSKRIKAIEKK